MLETLLCLALIDNLGNKNYHTRDQASKFLSVLSFQHHELIKEFATDRNPERARRIQGVLFNGLVGDIVYAVEEKARNDFKNTMDSVCGPQWFPPIPPVIPLPPF